MRKRGILILFVNIQFFFIIITFVSYNNIHKLTTLNYRTDEILHYKVSLFLWQIGADMKIGSDRLDLKWAYGL